MTLAKKHPTKRKMAVAKVTSSAPRSEAGLKAYKITVNNVKLSVREPSPGQVEKNIIAGQKALSRAKKVIVKPGVRLSFSDRVPIFSVDSSNPELIVMRLNGKSVKGKFVGGKFKPKA